MIRSFAGRLAAGLCIFQGLLLLCPWLAAGHPSFHPLIKPVFEENVGQAQGEVRFLSRLGEIRVFLTPGEILLAFAGDRGEASGRAPVGRMRFLGSHPDVVLRGEGLRTGVHRYLRPGLPIRTAATYQAVRYSELYPGVDLLLHFTERGLEMDFWVAPGARPQQIEWELLGGSLSSQPPELVWEPVPGRKIRLSVPAVTQQEGAVTHVIAGGLGLRGGRRVGFRLASHDPRLSLLIDPLLSFSSYLGGSGSDTAFAVSSNARGEVYVAGATASLDFPTGEDAFQRAPGGGSDAFVAKLDAQGEELIFATYLGGSGEDLAVDLVLDAQENIYLLGRTDSPDFPTTPGSFQPQPGGGTDLFVSRLSSDGSQLLASTFFGRGGDESAAAIALDAEQNVYLAGGTDGELPLPQDSRTPLNGFTGTPDAFVAKLTAGLDRLLYTFPLGGSRDDDAADLAVDSFGQAHVTGYTRSPDFPTTPGAFDRTCGSDGTCDSSSGQGRFDVFLAKISPQGDALLYSTFLGGRGDDGPLDFGQSLALDAQGNAYLAAATTSDDFPTTQGALDRLCGSDGACDVQAFPRSDAFVSKLNSSGSTLLFSTYLGGSGEEGVTGLGLDQEQRVLVAGVTSSPDFPVTPDAFQGAAQGGLDAFLTRLDPQGSRLLWSSYLGGEADDLALALAVQPSGSAHVVGSTLSDDFPVASFQEKRAGLEDGYVALFLEPHSLFFAQFGDGRSGGNQLFSQIQLLNLHPSRTARLSVELRNPAGQPLSVDLNGQPVQGQANFQIPPGGTLQLNTDGEGPLVRGSVSVSSDTPLAGVVLFGGSVGFAGVPSSRPLRAFRSPVSIGPQTNTGIALQNLGEEQEVNLDLLDSQGQVMAQASLTLPALGQIALFVTEIAWDRPVNLQDFLGSIRANGQGEMAATVILTRPKQFATLPVVEPE